MATNSRKTTLILASFLAMLCVVTSCPVTTARCSCVWKVIKCKDLGTITEFPQFVKGNVTYELFSMEGETVLSVLPNFAFQNLQVHRIKLVNQGLAQIEPNAFSGLGSVLQYISLQSNRLTTLPTQAFRALRNARHINIDHNDITSIQSGTFSGMSELQTLSITWNEISVLEHGAFDGLGSLLTLHLEHNKLNHVSTEAFRGLSHLTDLYLSNNQIKFIANGLFKHLPSLKVIYMNNNLIDTIDPGAFNSLTNMEKLYFHSNKLTTASYEVFGRFSEKEQNVDLGGNPIQCNCGVFWIRCISYSAIARQRCQYPVSFRLQTLRDFPASGCTCPDVTTTVRSDPPIVTKKRTTPTTTTTTTSTTTPTPTTTPTTTTPLPTTTTTTPKPTTTTITSTTVRTTPSTTVTTTTTPPTTTKKPTTKPTTTPLIIVEVEQPKIYHNQTYSLGEVRLRPLEVDARDYDNSLYVSWLLRNSTSITGFLLTYREADEKTIIGSVYTNHTYRRYELADLEPGTRYHICVHALGLSKAMAYKACTEAEIPQSASMVVWYVVGFWVLFIIVIAILDAKTRRRRCCRCCICCCCYVKSSQTLKEEKYELYSMKRTEIHNHNTTTTVVEAPMPHSYIALNLDEGPGNMTVNDSALGFDGHPGTSETNYELPLLRIDPPAMPGPSRLGLDCSRISLNDLLDRVPEEPSNQPEVTSDDTDSDASGDDSMGTFIDLPCKDSAYGSERTLTRAVRKALQKDMQTTIVDIFREKELNDVIRDAFVAQDVQTTIRNTFEHDEVQEALRNALQSCIRRTFEETIENTVQRSMGQAIGSAVPWTEMMTSLTRNLCEQWDRRDIDMHMRWTIADREQTEETCEESRLIETMAPPRSDESHTKFPGDDKCDFEADDGVC